MHILKQGASARGRAGDADIRRTVESIIDDVGTRGDAAVRDLSTRLDAWSPDSFRLTPGQIADCMAELPPQVLDDIRFAQAQVRGFAEHQRAALHEIEVETLPGVVLGHKNIPVNSVGCYVPGGRYPMVASAHMSIVTARVAGVKRVIACTPPLNGRPPAATVAA
ncbi:MAG TPA: histidinol dehydrogenase, partial [Roseiflexaceae bacterium]|nr:histidinol dehydrogenase [Roseiflexaceae bacterium]